MKVSLITIIIFLVIISVALYLLTQGSGGFITRAEIYSPKLKIVKTEVQAQAA